MSLRGDPPRWARHPPLAQAWTQSCLCLEPHDLSIVHAWLPLRSSLWHNLMAAQSAVASQAWTLGDSSPALTTVCARFPTRKATAQCPSARLGCLKGPSQSPIAGPGGRLCGLLPSLQKSSRRRCPAHIFFLRLSRNTSLIHMISQGRLCLCKDAIHGLSRRWHIKQYEQRKMANRQHCAQASKQNGCGCGGHEDTCKDPELGNDKPKPTYQKKEKDQSLHSHHIYQHTAESPTAAITRALNQIRRLRYFRVLP